MSVTEKLMAQGTFTLNLDLSLVPNSILNAIQPFDQIVITNNEMETQDLIDNVMLPSSEYIGVIKELSIEPETAYVEGAGLQFYLGEDDAPNSKTLVAATVKIAVVPVDAAASTTLIVVGNDTGATASITITNNFVI